MHKAQESRENSRKDDLDAIADGGHPSAGDALGTAESAKGGSDQHQSRCLMYAEPVTLPEMKLDSIRLCWRSA